MEKLKASTAGNYILKSRVKKKRRSFSLKTSVFAKVCHLYPRRLHFTRVNSQQTPASWYFEISGRPKANTQLLTVVERFQMLQRVVCCDLVQCILCNYMCLDIPFTIVYPFSLSLSLPPSPSQQVRLTP